MKGILKKSYRLNRAAVVIALVALPLLYVASFGPACWLAARPSHEGRDGMPSNGMVIYWPLAEHIADEGIASRPLEWWMTVGIKRDFLITVPVNIASSAWIIRYGN